jgi:hypothetical protein
MSLDFFDLSPKRLCEVILPERGFESRWGHLRTPGGTGLRRMIAATVASE